MRDFDLSTHGRFTMCDIERPSARKTYIVNRTVFDAKTGLMRDVIPPSPEPIKEKLFDE